MPEAKLRVSSELLFDCVRMLPPGYRFVGAELYDSKTFLVTLESDRLRGDEGVLMMTVETFPGGYTVRLVPTTMPDRPGTLSLP